MICSKFHIITLLAAMALLIPSCATSSKGKKVGLKDTHWVCVQELFVADAGTQTETYTIDFVSADECVVKNKSVLPAHPATYVNPDGSIDTIPERKSESVSRAKWVSRYGKLILQLEDGTTRVLELKNGKLEGPGPYGEEMVFEKQ